MSSKQTIEERLESYPELRSRMEQIVAIAENKDGDLIRADDVEERVTQALQKLGQEVIQGWAETESERQAQALKSTGRSHQHGKKNSTGTLNTDGSLS